MLVTASTTSDGAPLGRRVDARWFDRSHLVAAWTVWAIICTAVMFVRPGQGTIPYHLGWAGFALAFGLGTWTKRQLVISITWYTLATGAIFERNWLGGDIGWDETTEVPLMLLLALLMVWHVRRRQAALAQVTTLAEREVQACLDREQLMQLTSHELRTPLTIARGYIELLQTRAKELENKQDLSVVFDELERLARVSDRLIRMIRLQDDTTTEMVDIDYVMAEVVERWRVVADRRWLLDGRAGRDLGSPERLRTGLDTLIENAIRYTSVGDTIRLVGSRNHKQIVVGVYDSGVGLTDQQIMVINTRDSSSSPGVTDTETGTEPGADPEADPQTETKDGLAGTGLGLSIVRALANARGGTLHASHAPDGGAAMILTFPLDGRGGIGSFVPRELSSSAPVKPDAKAPRRLVAPGVSKS
ncbi:MAG: HAMP domain-containing sensor histidine kinase [Dermatophilaceae bacterium]